MGRTFAPIWAGVVTLIGVVLAASPAQASPITFSGTFTNDSDVVLFDISGSGTFTASTSGYAQGGFNPLMFLFDPVNGWWPVYTGNGQRADQSLTFAVDRTFLLMLSVADNEPDQNLAHILFFQTDPKFTAVMYGCANGQFCTRDHQSRNGTWAITFTSNPGVTFSEVGALSAVPTPSTILLFATGLGLMVLGWRKRSGRINVGGR